MEKLANIRLGFSTGCLYKSGLNLIQCLDLLRSTSCRVVELGFVKFKDFLDGEFKNLTAQDFRDFDYVSFHAPVLNYGFNSETRDVFNWLSILNLIRPLDLIVFHPDTVEDFSIFLTQNFPFAFENMDKRKKSFKLPKSIQLLTLMFRNFKMVLDVNHAYTNDPSTALTVEFYEKLGDKVVQIHLSGYTGYHEPLFQNKQAEIIKSIQDTSVPIIVEGVLKPEELVLERNYILETLAGA
ncbi:MAG: hypothetical protein HYT61_02610 [Candidatus Yanofskybacteria bacterium]|nr:hypothetical protein [Candidatus Yanofskybacteria bacterium]